jgi:hypothetical protein
MRNRQHIQKLVLAGRLGDAIATVEELYPGLLHLHQDLHFKLKVTPPVGPPAPRRRLDNS